MRCNSRDNDFPARSTPRVPVEAAELERIVGAGGDVQVVPLGTDSKHVALDVVENTGRCFPAPHASGESAVVVIECLDTRKGVGALNRGTLASSTLAFEAIPDFEDGARIKDVTRHLDVRDGDLFIDSDVFRCMNNCSVEEHQRQLRRIRLGQ